MKLSEIKVSETTSPPTASKVEGKKEDVICLRCRGVVESNNGPDTVEKWCWCMPDEQVTFDPHKHFGGRSG